MEVHFGGGILRGSQRSESANEQPTKKANYHDTYEEGWGKEAWMEKKRTKYTHR